MWEVIGLGMIFVLCFWFFLYFQVVLDEILVVLRRNNELTINTNKYLQDIWEHNSQRK